jgi:hypothetical protein
MTLAEKMNRSFTEKKDLLESFSGRIQSLFGSEEGNPLENENYLRFLERRDREREIRKEILEREDILRNLKREFEGKIFLMQVKTASFYR